MENQPSPFDFEQFQPREPVTIPTPRRGLVRALLGELHAYNTKTDGIPTLKLTDLAALSDEELARIRPMRMDGCKVNLQNQLVWAKQVDAIEPVVLFPVDSPALTAFNLFNGKNDLNCVRHALVEVTGWPEEKAWAYTRGLFLKLISLRVCVPK